MAWLDLPWPDAKSLLCPKQVTHHAHLLRNAVMLLYVYVLCICFVRSGWLRIAWTKPMFVRFNGRTSMNALKLVSWIGVLPLVEYSMYTHMHKKRCLHFAGFCIRNPWKRKKLWMAMNLCMAGVCGSRSLYGVHFGHYLPQSRASLRIERRKEISNEAETTILKEWEEWHGTGTRLVKTCVQKF